MNGNVPDPRNLYRDCKKYEINPCRTTQDLVEMDLFICNKNPAELQLKAPGMRRAHLNNPLKLTKDTKDGSAVKAIESILHGETKQKR